MTEAVDAPRRGPGPLVAVCALVYLPFTFLGYGTDIDVANVLRAGRSVLDDGDYQMSRGPGAAVHEVTTAVLDRLGGSVLVNLASVAFAGLALWAVHELERHERGPWPAGALLVLASNPWFWIAATSLGDFTWALGLALAGAVAAQRDRRVVAGVLFGLAIGCRASTVLVVVAWLLAEAGDRSGRPSRRGLLITGAVALVVALLCFVPPWLEAGRTLDFVANETRFAGFGAHVGRWLVKNAAVIGVPAGVVLLVGWRQAAGALSRWRSSTVVRFAVVTIVLQELLFFRLPFKPVHLLPVVAGAALLIGASPRAGRRWLTALVAAQLVGALVGTTLAAPDVRDAAQSGRIDLGLHAGALLTDVGCRLDDRRLGPWPGAATLEATERAGANADCQSGSWRSG